MRELGTSSARREFSDAQLLAGVVGAKWEQTHGHAESMPGQKRKQPYYIRLKGGAPFAFAGLWTPPHLAPPTCTMITTTPNEYQQKIKSSSPGLPGSSKPTG